MLKILHFWSKGPHVGDYFYARSQQAMLRELFGDVLVSEGTCARHYPSDQGITRQMLMEPADLVIVGGGPLYDLLGSQGNLFVNREDLAECGKPVLVWSTGIDAPLDNNRIVSDTVLKAVDSLHGIAKAAAVRDTATQNWLATRGYTSTVTGDAAHFLTDIKPVRQQTGKVLFSWRHDLCEGLGTPIREWVHWCEGQGFETELICLTKGDMESARNMNLPFFYAENDVDAYIQTLGTAAIVLGCRVHAAIVALIQGVPAHCFYATSRIRAWGDELFDDRRYVLPIEDLTFSKLCERTIFLLNGDIRQFNRFTEKTIELRQKTIQWLRGNVG